MKNKFLIQCCCYFFAYNFFQNINNTFASSFGPFKRMEITKELKENVKIEKGGLIYVDQIVRAKEKTDGQVLYRLEFFCSSSSKRSKPSCSLYRAEGGAGQVSGVEKSATPPPAPAKK